MRLDSGRIVRNVICLVSLLAFASTPLLAQTGIDLLDAEQVRRATEQPGEAGGTATVRATLDYAPTGVVQASHARETIRYDDGEFENFAANSGLNPNDSEIGGSVTVEWAQRFVVKADGTVVSARVCFLRPEGDTSRAVDFNLRFYADTTANRVNFPGSRAGLRYTIEEDIRRAGDHRCFLLRGALVGKPLTKGRPLGRHRVEHGHAETPRRGSLHGRRRSGYQPERHARTRYGDQAPDIAGRREHCPTMDGLISLINATR